MLQAPRIVRRTLPALLLPLVAGWRPIVAEITLLELDPNRDPRALRPGQKLKVAS